MLPAVAAMTPNFQGAKKHFTLIYGMANDGRTNGSHKRLPYDDCVLCLRAPVVLLWLAKLYKTVASCQQKSSCDSRSAALPTQTKPLLKQKRWEHGAFCSLWPAFCWASSLFDTIAIRQLGKTKQKLIQKTRGWMLRLLQEHKEHTKRRPIHPNFYSSSSLPEILLTLEAHRAA